MRRVSSNSYQLLPDKQFLMATQGLPGSGKSTYALRLIKDNRKVGRVNRDAIRLMLHGERFDPKFEREITVLRDASIRALLDRGWSVVNDDTNLSEARLNELANIASEFSADFVVNDSFMSVSVDKCIENDLKRPASVGRDVIERMYADYWKEQPKPQHHGTASIIVDLDGTLAHTDIPFPAAYDRDYTTDRLDERVLDAVKAAYAAGYHIVILTGREGTDTRRSQTEEWLRFHRVPYDRMFMRAEGDRRDDAIVKKELYMNHVFGTAWPLYVIDDRPRVVRMWRHELGLSTMQVGDGRIF